MAALSTLAALALIGGAGASVASTLKNKPQTPPTLLTPPTAPTLSDTQDEAARIAAARLQAQRRAGVNKPATILTSFQGVPQPAPVTRKTLLGS